MNLLLSVLLCAFCYSLWKLYDPTVCYSKAWICHACIMPHKCFSSSFFSFFPFFVCFCIGLRDEAVLFFYPSIALAVMHWVSQGTFSCWEQKFTTNHAKKGNVLEATGVCGRKQGSYQTSQGPGIRSLKTHDPRWLYPSLLTHVPSHLGFSSCTSTLLSDFSLFPCI